MNGKKERDEKQKRGNYFIWEQRHKDKLAQGKTAEADEVPVDIDTKFRSIGIKEISVHL